MDEPLQSPSFRRSMPPLAYAGQRIGVMGGTFNPPHEGHALVATTALRRLKLDQLWWMVTPGNPLKIGNGLPPLAERLAASRRLVTDPRITVTGFEEGLGQSYTYATLTHLVTRMPGVHFVWVMGADNLASFHHWRRWREIAEMVPIAVVDRPGWRFRALAAPAAVRLMPFRVPEIAAGSLARMHPPAWVFLSTRLSDASSTALRGTAGRS